MNTEKVPREIETKASEIHRIFNLQKENHFTIANSNYANRKGKLKKLHQAILRYRPEIKAALFKDFHKHPSEVDLTEIFGVTSQIKHAKRELRKWMSKERVPTPLPLLGSSSHIRYQPKGVVLIISPWNFPILLTLGPLVSAIAAGNAVMLKPSEMTPHASAIMGKMLAEIFEENEVALIEGGVSTATELLKLPFNHIFFTGSPNVGKIVMRAAAEHLCSVTLELGGKSPTIVDESSDIDKAAQRIVWGKFMNNGQTCIAPDYVFVHESRKEDFIHSFKNQVTKLYSENVKEEASYARMVNQHHYSRVKSYVDDALDKGAKIEQGGDFDPAQFYLSPTLVSAVSTSSKLMTEEIFGPVLPLFTFKNIDEVIREINSRENPLALYIYSRSSKNIEKIIAGTRAGGTCVNHNNVHFSNTHLPFGGVNHSGIGKTHGFEGFKAFSNARGIYEQKLPSISDWLMPPFNDFKQRLIDWTIKWL